ncbi:hypothetical protein GQ607_002896 [Colletotrichum asianum]|uniref:Uncharacterized protein n=1 Tax=Colletotrichum asianum TaxID=702518 RepID=A0A8H3ZS31_9PEZI|nr:hypothetical protein GQ607_002896 [Colletotrichum asianum]
MSASAIAFQLKLIIAVITATFATQENRHAWASVASLVCLLLWISIAIGLFLYRQPFLLRYRLPVPQDDRVKTLTRSTQEGNPQHSRSRRAYSFLECHSLHRKLRPRPRLPFSSHHR